MQEIVGREIADYFHCTDWAVVSVGSRSAAKVTVS